MQNIFTNIKCSEIIWSNANENWYIILYDLFSRLCYIATCGPFCKDATHMINLIFHSLNVMVYLYIDYFFPLIYISLNIIFVLVFRLIEI